MEGGGGKGGGKGRKRAAIKATFAAYISLSRFFQSNSSGVGRDSEMMGGICFLVVVDSYAIALIPFSFPSPFFFPFFSIF